MGNGGEPLLDLRFADDIVVFATSSQQAAYLLDELVIALADVPCFAAGHRKVYKTDLETMDINFRRLLRSVVGPPSQTNWLNPWHEILHDWNARVAGSVEEAGILTWLHRSLQQYWLLQNLYNNQTGQIVVTNESSRLFDIKRGVRQGCVLSPRPFCAVLEMAMGMWRGRVSRLGLDLGDGGPTLLDVRFADDISIFATACIDAGVLLDELVACLSQVGVVLNTDKTKVMTTEAQPPSFLLTPAGLKIEILNQKSCHKWLGCMVSMPTVVKKRHDVDQHVQAASNAFFCHRATLCDRNVSIGKRLRYFDAVISPVAVFAARHRTMYRTDPRNFDVLFRKLLRSVVGPPAVMALHDWNGRVNEFAAHHGIKLWSERCVQQHWDLAHYNSSLED